MIEWYRLEFDLAQLMDEVAALVELVLGAGAIGASRTPNCSTKGRGWTLCEARTTELTDALAHLGIEMSADAVANRRDMLDLLATHATGRTRRRAGLRHRLSGRPGGAARVVTDAKGRDVAQRFELVIDGVEIANGYDELARCRVLERRMTATALLRARATGRDAPVADQRLLAAMRTDYRAAPVLRSASID